MYSLSKKDELRREDLCCRGVSRGSKISMYACVGSTDEKWRHSKGGPIVHVNTGLCLDVTDVKNGEYPVLNDCNPNKPGQNWEFRVYY